MDLKHIHPESLAFFSENGIQYAVKVILMRVNFIPAARHVVGWRGSTDISADNLGWTTKIKQRQGIFGLAYSHQNTSHDWIGGFFHLYYFPWPGEDLIEYYSVKAALLTEESGYMDRVRDFLKHPDFASVFHIATLEVAVHRSEEAFLCGIEALSEYRVIADEGLPMMKDGEVMQIVKRGEYDQKFPAFEVATDFFHVFAASTTFNVDEPPSFLLTRRYQGSKIHYNREGSYRHEESNDVTDDYLCLGYGNSDFLAGFERAILERSDEPLEDVVWHSADPNSLPYSDALWWSSHHLEEARHVDEASIGIDARVPLIVVSGFLGSGKTSFIKSFIDFNVQRNRFVAVIQNEIGEVGLDGKLLEDEFAVTEIDEGCVCCSLVGSIRKAISDILAKYTPDFIILETTGMANPFNLLDEMIEIKDVVRFDGITTVVDASNIMSAMDDYGIAAHQVEAADVLVVNKTDLVNEEELSTLKTHLREKNARAPVLTVEHGYINPSILYGSDPDEGEVGLPDAHGISANLRGTHMDDGLESRKLVLPEIVNRKTFLSLLESFPIPAFRIKGIVQFDDYEQPCVLQYVNGRYDISERSSSRFDEAFLVVIGRDIGTAPLDDYFEKARVTLSLPLPLSD